MDDTFYWAQQSNTTTLCWLDTITNHLETRIIKLTLYAQRQSFSEISLNRSIHLNIGACRNLDAVSTVTDHIILHYLPAATKPDTVAIVFIDAVTAKLHSAVLLHCNASPAIFNNAVSNEPGQLSALQHSNARAAVSVHKVCKNIQGLAALHIQANRYRKTETGEL